MVEQIKVGKELFVVPNADLPRSDRRAKLERQIAYMAWLLVPKDERNPRTKTQFAQQLGVTIQTLLAYERDPDFTMALRERLAQAFRVDRLPSLFESLYATAMDSQNPRQVQAARTLLEWFGRTENRADELVAMSIEELEALAASG